MLLIVNQNGKELYRNPNWIGYFGKYQEWFHHEGKKYPLFQWVHNVTGSFVTAEVGEEVKDV